MLNPLVLGESDGEYRLKLAWGQGNVHIFPQTVKITVKGECLFICFIGLVHQKLKLFYYLATLMPFQTPVTSLYLLNTS